MTISNLILAIVQDLLKIIHDGGDAEAVKAKVLQRLVDGINELRGIDGALDAMWADLHAAVPE